MGSPFWRCRERAAEVALGREPDARCSLTNTLLCTVAAFAVTVSVVVYM